MEKQQSNKGDAAHVEDATRVRSNSPIEKEDPAALEAGQPPNAKNKVSLNAQDYKKQKSSADETNSRLPWASS
jgi:hypothetical protein